MTAQNPAVKQKNRENNRGIFEFELETIELCKFGPDQAINKEFCGFLPKTPATKQLVLLNTRFEQITGRAEIVGAIGGLFRSLNRRSNL